MIPEQPRSSISRGTVEGRSPGSRVLALCSTFPVSQWSLPAAGSPYTVAGAATASTRAKRLPRSLFILSDAIFEEPSTPSRWNIVRTLSISAAHRPRLAATNRVASALGALRNPLIVFSPPADLRCQVSMQAGFSSPTSGDMRDLKHTEFNVSRSLQALPPSSRS